MFSVVITSFCCCMWLFCYMVESIFNIASDYCMCRLVSAVQSWVSGIQLNRVFYFIQGDYSVTSLVTAWVRRKSGKYFSWKWHNICSQMWKDHRISFSFQLYWREIIVLNFEGWSLILGVTAIRLVLHVWHSSNKFVYWFLIIALGYMHFRGGSEFLYKNSA